VTGEPIAADAGRNANPIRYSICTLVTDRDEYVAMVASFKARGFCQPAADFLYLDNTAGNRFDAYGGINLFLRVARSEYAILCHQDVRLIADGIDRLDALIAEMDRNAPDWALLGNAGTLPSWRIARRISDPHGDDVTCGPLPARVVSLDENFIIVRRAANLGLSRDLAGFHLYGTDLCQVADLLGWSAWVVDFHLRHNSGGTTGPAFAAARRAFIAKYRRALRSRLVATTCTTMGLSGTGPVAWALNSYPVRKVANWRRRSPPPVTSQLPMPIKKS
jgi:hypothetical protein